MVLRFPQYLRYQLVIDLLLIFKQNQIFLKVSLANNAAQ